MTGPKRSESMLRDHARHWTFWGSLLVLAGVVYLLAVFFRVCVEGVLSIPGGAL